MAVSNDISKCAVDESTLRERLPRDKSRNPRGTSGCWHCL